MTGSRYVAERPRRDAVAVPAEPPLRGGRRVSDDYEQMLALSRARATRPDGVRALDESYVFTRLLQGRVPNELVDGLRVRCPDAFRAAETYGAPVAAPQRRELVQAFTAAWHKAHSLRVPRFDRTFPPELRAAREAAP